MKTVIWLVIAACVAGIAFALRQLFQRQAERRRAEEERFAAFMAAAAVAKPKHAEPEPPLTAAAGPAAPLPLATDGLAQQKMLFEAAHKAGEAGEPALAIQLYGRLLARYPATAFAEQARAGAAALKKKLVKA